MSIDSTMKTYKEYLILRWIGTWSVPENFNPGPFSRKKYAKEALDKEQLDESEKRLYKIIQISVPEGPK